MRNNFRKKKFSLSLPLHHSLSLHLSLSWWPTTREAGRLPGRRRAVGDLRRRKRKPRQPSLIPPPLSFFLSLSLSISLFLSFWLWLTGDRGYDEEEAGPGQQRLGDARWATTPAAVIGDDEQYPCWVIKTWIQKQTRPDPIRIRPDLPS